MIDLLAIGREAEKGLPNERIRLDDAEANLAFFNLEFERFGTPIPTNGQEAPPIRRATPFMRRVVDLLGSWNYARGPAREFPESPELSAWLQAEYARDGVDGLIQEADRLAFAADAAALQVIGSGDPDHPLDFQLWPADQFAVWVDPATPAEPLVVATIDLYDEARRIRLWSAETVLTYSTDKLMPGQTAGGTAYRLQGEDPNPYGCLPFAFTHAKPPSTQFWSRGPGTLLRQVNDGLNFSLTDSYDALRYAGRPLRTVFGSDSKPPSPQRPGDIWFLTAAAVDAANNGIPPTVETLAGDTAFTEAAWADLQNMIDLTLEGLGVPPASIRMVQSGARSGVSIVTEQIPLILWAAGRQPAFGVFERQLARVAIAVAAAELARLQAPPLAFLDPAQADRLTLRWPSMVPDVPLVGPARAQQDALDLALGKISRVHLVMRDMNLTEEAARAHLLAVAANLKWETSIGLPSIPAPSSNGASSDAQE